MCDSPLKLRSCDCFPVCSGHTGDRENVPKLSSEQLKAIFSHRRKKAEAENSVDHWQSCAVDLSKISRDVKRRIENIYRDEQEIKQRLVNPRLGDADKIELNDLLFRKQQKLMECLDLEDECFCQLSRVRACARRAGLDLDRAIRSTPIEVDNLNAVYEAKKLRNASDRIGREITQKQRAEAVKFSAMKNFLAMTLDKALEEHDDSTNQAALRKRRSESDWTTHVYYRKTLASRQSVKEESKRAAKAAAERRQVALQKLQEQILKSRKELQLETQEILRTNKIKQERFQQNLGLDAGDNPYLVEKITSLCRKVKKAEKQANECNTQAEMLVLNEIKQREVHKNRQILQKKKMEQFWKKLASQKRQRFQQQETLEATLRELDRGDGWIVDSGDAVEGEEVVNQVKNANRIVKSRTSLELSSATARTAGAESNNGATRAKNIPLPTVSLTVGSKTSVFHIKPSSLLFMDFEIGKTYITTVAVTHQSRNRLKYYFKGIMEDPTLQESAAPLSEVLTVDFNDPPLLSPGIVHRFKVKFKPISNVNSSGNIVFTCNLGDFDLPVKIWKKNFKPEIVGGSQVKIPSTVINQSTTEIIKIRNKGALPGWLTEIIAEPSPGNSELAPTSNIQTVPEQNVQPFAELEPPDVIEASSAKEKKASTKNVTKKKKTQKGSEVQSSTAKRKAKGGTPRKTKSKGRPRNSIEASEAVGNILEELLKRVTEAPFVIYVRDSQRLIPPNGSLSLAVLFRPEFAGPHELKSTLLLHSEELMAVEIPLHLLGQGIEVPIRVIPQNVNLKICAINKVYQSIVTVSVDTSDKDMEVKSVIPKELQQFVSIQPAEFKRVTAAKQCNFTVRFQPTAALFDGPSKNFFDQATSIADWPIDFIAISKSSSCSVRATFMAVVTNTELLIVPDEVNFGRCLSNGTATTKIQIHNSSLMMQKIGIRDISKELTLQPNYGFVTILPQEFVELDLLLSPNDSQVSPGKPQKYFVKLVSLCSREYSITVKATVVNPIAKLNPNKIFLPPLAAGSYAEIFLTLENLLFLAGEKAGLSFDAGSHSFPEVKVTPAKGHLGHKETTKLRIVYRPQITEDQMKDHYLLLHRLSHEKLLRVSRQELSLIRLQLYFDEDFQHDPGDSLEQTEDVPVVTTKPTTKPKKTKKKNPSATSNSLKSLSNQSQFQKLKNPSDIVARKNQLEQLLSENKYVPPNQVELPTDPVELTNLRNDLLRNLQPSVRSTILDIDVSKQGSDENIKETVFAEIIAAIVKPELILVNQDSVVNFGQLQVGSRLVKEIAVQNKSDQTIHLQCDLLPPQGPFMHLNALRPLEPDQVYVFRVSFAPVAEGQYSEEFVIKSGSSKLLVSLQGTGSEAPVKIAKLKKVLKNPKKKKVVEPKETKKLKKLPS